MERQVQAAGSGCPGKENDRSAAVTLAVCRRTLDACSPYHVVYGCRIVKNRVLLSLVVASLVALHSTSFAGVFSGRPDVLVCSVDDPVQIQPWDQFVFYVSARLKDGAVLYKSLTSNPVLVKITVDGRVEAENLKDCDGRSIAELRDEGRAFDFPAASSRR